MISHVSDIRKDVSYIKADVSSIKTETLYIRVFGLVIIGKKKNTNVNGNVMRLFGDT